jgi:hypothetical protein
MPKMDKRLLDLFSKDLSTFALKHIKGGYVPEPEEVKDYDNLKALLQTYIFESDLVQEKFIVEVAGPEDVGLDKYLIRLAKYVNSELRNGNEDGVNIDELKVMAYHDSMPIIPFEQMLKNASAWEDYFSYLLMKDERVLIKASQIEDAKKYAGIFLKDMDFSSFYHKYAKTSTTTGLLPPEAPSILNTTMKSSFNEKGKVSRAYTFAEDDNYYILRNLQGSVPIPTSPSTLVFCPINFLIVEKKTKNTMSIMFDVVDSITNFPSFFERNTLDLTVGLNHLYLTQPNFELGKITHYFAVADDAGRSYSFKVTDKTIEKSIQKINKIVKKYAWHRKSKNWSLPYEFATKSVTL